MDVVTYDPIDEYAVETRLELGYWPQELDPQDVAAPSTYHRALTGAGEVFAFYRALRRALRDDPRLTPAGVQAELKKWAETNLPKLEKSLEDTRKTAAGVEAFLPKKLLENVAPPATEPADLALMQEVRSYLRGLPEEQRMDTVRQLAAKGDNSALRAVLTAPAYLTGLDDTLLGHIRDNAMQAADPDRFAKLEACRKAATLAERALDGVVRYIHTEVHAPLPPTVVQPATRPQPPVVPLSDEAREKIASAFDTAMAAQAASAGAQAA